MNKLLIVGISGVTNGGKSTLALKLKELWTISSIIHIDELTKPMNKLKYDSILDYHNWDEVETYDWERIKKEVTISSQNLLNSSRQLACLLNFYNLHEHHPILFIEGILLFNSPIDEIFDIRIFFTLDKEECWKRRKERVYEPPEPPGYFEKYCWPLYMFYKSELENKIKVDSSKSSNIPYNINFIKGDKAIDETLLWANKEIYTHLLNY
ncbi:unnamed protein product [Gordionus sp. m RMFG-2023]|uniref:nicotinamide riboside kinase 1-like n=1 Tax=Gordionus sp. m RMFG-2023 TaxID=3053472 RepID=UPI0030DFC48C